MFRGLLFCFGVAIVVCVVLYFTTRRARYLAWARRIFLSGLGLGVVFFLVMLFKRLV